MKTVKYLLLGGIVLTLCLGARSVRTEGECREQAETFLNNVMQKKLDSAFGILLESAKGTQQKDAVETLKIRTETALMLLGKPVGMEFIRSQKYGESVVRLVYIVKYQPGPLIWEFYFYKAEDEWSLVGVEFSDRLSALSER